MAGNTPNAGEPVLAAEPGRVERRPTPTNRATVARPEYRAVAFSECAGECSPKPVEPQCGANSPKHKLEPAATSAEPVVAQPKLPVPADAKAVQHPSATPYPPKRFSAQPLSPQLHSAWCLSAQHLSKHCSTALPAKSKAPVCHAGPEHTSQSSIGPDQS